MVNKVVTGIELLNMIVNKEFKDGDKIKWIEDIYCYIEKEKDFYCEDNNDYLLSCHSVITILENEFEIISKDEEIDIKKIEKLVLNPYDGTVINIDDIENKINELIRAIKQINKKLED